MPDPEVKIKVSSTESGGASALSKVRSEIGQLVGAIPGASAALGALGTAAGAIGVAMAGAAKAIHEFAQTEREVASLDAALAQFGQHTEEYRQRLQALAGELQEATAIADDQWLGVLTRLVQFGARPETIGMDVEAVKNLAGVVGDIESATSLYTKALQGNFDALGRYGIKVREIEELQRVAAERGGGQLEARARTLSGLYDRLANSTSDFFEALGQGIARTGIGQVVLGSLSDVMAGLATRFASAYESLQTYNRSSSEATQALAAYRAEAQQVVALTDEHVRVLQAESDLLSKKQSILDQLSDKESAMRIALVDLDAASGRISPQQAASARAGIRYESARDKIERARDTENGKQANGEAALAALVRQKNAVDWDIAMERKRVVPEERLASIRALVMSAAQSRQEYGAAGKQALGEFIGDPSGGRAWAATVNSDMAGMKAWEERMMARTQNTAALRSGRISTLEGMSTQLGERIAAMRSQTAGSAAFTRAANVGADMDLATAKMEQIKASASGANGALDGAARSVAMTLGENVSLSRSIIAELTDVRRQIANLKASVKNSANQ